MKCLRNLSINAPDFTRDKFLHQYHVVSIGDPAGVLDYTNPHDQDVPLLGDNVTSKGLINPHSVQKGRKSEVGWLRCDPDGLGRHTLGILMSLIVFGRFVTSYFDLCEVLIILLTTFLI